jgi:hypothetical protein
MKISRRKVNLALVAVALVGWLAVNPPVGRFGYCRAGWTVYRSVPRLRGDFQIRADGQVRQVPRSHSVTYDQIEWILESKPDLFIIGTGWEEAVRPDPSILSTPTCEVQKLPTPEAIRLYNAQRGKRRVAIHLHSTC